MYTPIHDAYIFGDIVFHICMIIMEIHRRE